MNINKPLTFGSPSHLNCPVLGGCQNCTSCSHLFRFFLISYHLQLIVVNLNMINGASSLKEIHPCTESHAVHGKPIYSIRQK